ncbi:hypothetical protein BDB00DRAFT_826298 [Zychaea mexicana]|uniref:uncharacterized protein n=1 Tax=Zychaea mexicana TaxID=64656 RepID=UPI0022FEB492|nr:uncharacterized protein BDB00DRAFT_826298 [Zychaea mexicana]KAI9492767.1 hypothetical protein BDB00DRAFT_826298 [Zychaea mexicana]
MIRRLAVVRKKLLLPLLRLLPARLLLLLLPRLLLKLPPERLPLPLPQVPHRQQPYLLYNILSIFLPITSFYKVDSVTPSNTVLNSPFCYIFCATTALSINPQDIRVFQDYVTLHCCWNQRERENDMPTSIILLLLLDNLSSSPPPFTGRKQKKKFLLKIVTSCQRKERDLFYKNKELTIVCFVLAISRMGQWFRRYGYDDGSLEPLADTLG